LKAIKKREPGKRGRPLRDEELRVFLIFSGSSPI
jgi:hypothetical protein